MTVVKFGISRNMGSKFETLSTMLPTVYYLLHRRSSKSSTSAGELSRAYLAVRTPWILFLDWNSSGMCIVMWPVTSTQILFDHIGLAHQHRTCYVCSWRLIRCLTSTFEQRCRKDKQREGEWEYVVCDASRVTQTLLKWSGRKMD